MTQLHSHDLARPDATIRYWTGGAADASPVVFLHAATLDHRAWHPQTDALLRHCLA
jgi:pimeloyl-ACP methyl ester carboxylesterase